jgi:hypothetical protein
MSSGRGETPFRGVDAPAIPFELDWKEPTCVMVDALGAVPPFTVGNGHLSLLLSNTPVFIEAADHEVGIRS